MARGLSEEEVRELYEKYAPVVHRRALTLVGREADAWDIVQEVFERLLRAGAGFRGEARPMTYIYRMTTNVSLNALRGRKVREPELPPPATEPSVGMEATEAVDLLRALARRLGERQLEVACLHFVDGLTQEEIAQVLGMSRKTIGRDMEVVRACAAELAGEPGRPEHA
jgi:RNA polymerase sigma-70 factor (ECF subfamily)